MTTARHVERRLAMAKGGKQSIIEPPGSLDVIRSYHRVKQQILSPIARRASAEWLMFRTVAEFPAQSRPLAPSVPVIRRTLVRTEKRRFVFLF